MSEDYRDSRIECAPTTLRIHWYYFPFGTKDVAYSSLKDVRRVVISTLRGKLRIWGTGTFRYWVNLDVRRPAKKFGFILDNGKAVKPFVTPDDPDAFEAVVRERAGLGPSTDSSKRSPWV
ncbi:MAG: PH domain-containing protein [Acidimicrobiales bacterium]